jgi:hypothetical protein
MSNRKIIAIETLGGPLHIMLRNILRMVPSKDQNDVALQRMLAFRLRIDGESATREYLMRKIRDMIQCRYNGRLYDFLSSEIRSPGNRKPARKSGPVEST